MNNVKSNYLKVLSFDDIMSNFDQYLSEKNFPEIKIPHLIKKTGVKGKSKLKKSKDTVVHVSNIYNYYKTSASINLFILFIF